LIIRSNWILPGVDVQYVFLFTFDLSGLRGNKPQHPLQRKGREMPGKLGYEGHSVLGVVILVDRTSPIHKILLFLVTSPTG
jgi:hypothetical protein